MARRLGAAAQLAAGLLLLLGAAHLFALDDVPLFVNATVSDHQIALNQPVRVDFTTMPRQIPDVDIASAVRNSLTVDAHATWRLLGEPEVTVHPKTGTIAIAITLLPRLPGDLMLPDLPLTWLAGHQVAHFGTVAVADAIAVGTARQPVPGLATSIHGIAWGRRFSEVEAHFAPSSIERSADGVWVQVEKTLRLHFVGGILAEAQLTAPGLSMEQARVSFLEQWGVPQLEDADSITWLIGWTRIRVSADQGALRIALVREDIQSNLDQTQVDAEVFAPLGASGPDPATAPAAPAPPAAAGPVAAPAGPAPAPDAAPASAGGR
jgi:hypothetical protein